MGICGSRVGPSSVTYVTRAPFYIHENEASWLTPESRVECAGVWWNLKEFLDRGQLELVIRSTDAFQRWQFRIYPAGTRLIVHTDGAIYVKDNLYADGVPHVRNSVVTRIFPGRNMVLTEAHIELGKQPCWS
jgi:hypothetical protein